RRVAPLEVLNAEVIAPAVMADVVHAADVRMLEPRARLGLALEALAHVGRVARVTGENLDRDGSIQAPILGAINLAHPAVADRLGRFRGAEYGPRRQARTWGSSPAR